MISHKGIPFYDGDDDDDDDDDDIDDADDDDDDDNPMILNYRAKNYTSERTIVPWTVIFWPDKDKEGYQHSRC